MSLRILHLTDLHIDSINLFSRNYVRNIEILRMNLNLLSPDVVVISGDIVEFGEGIMAKSNYKILNDLFYYSDGSFYFDREMKIPLYFVPGNHEYGTIFKFSFKDIPNYRSFIGSKFLNYYVDIKNVRLIFLDTGYDYSYSFHLHNLMIPSSEGVGLFKHQLEFLEDALKNSNNTNIIITHHPFISPRNGVQEDVFVLGREEFKRIITSYDVSVILSGHTHKNRVFDNESNLITSFPLIAKGVGPYHVQTGSIGKDGYYRIIEVRDQTVIIYDAENCKDYLTYKTQENKEVSMFDETY